MTERTDHVEAAKEALMLIWKKLDDGASPEDIGAYVVLLGRLMERKS